MLQVKVKKNNVEYALRLLKRKIKDSGLMVELRERQYYTKPSVKMNLKNITLCTLLTTVVGCGSLKDPSDGLSGRVRVIEWDEIGRASCRERV